MYNQVITTNSQGLGMVRKRLLEIKDMVGIGHVFGMRKALEELRQKKAWSIEESMIASEIYRKMGAMDKAFGCLGRRWSKDELLRASDGVLKKHVQMAFILQFTGAVRLALDLLNDIQEAADNKGSLVTDIYPGFHRIHGHTLRSWGDASKALWHYDKYVEELTQYNSADHYCRLHIVRAFCMNTLGRTDEALAVFDDIMTKTGEDYESLRFLVPIYRCFMYENLEDWKSFFEDVEWTKSLKMEKKQFVDKGDMLCKMGLYHLKKNEFETAASFLDRAMAIYTSGKMRPDNHIEVIDLKCQIPGLVVPIDQRIALHAHPYFTYFPYLHGRPWNEEESRPLPYWIKKFLTKDKSNDCWLIRNKEITPAVYHQSGNSDSPIVCDLVAGVIIDKKTKRLQELTTYQAKLIATLMGGGSLGIIKYALFDYLYDEKEFTIQHSNERVRKMIKSIKALGFDVSYKDDYFTIHPDWSWEFLLPMDHNPRGLYAYISRTRNSFSCMDLQDEFRFSERTALRHIHEWMENHGVEKLKKGRFVRYYLKAPFQRD